MSLSMKQFGLAFFLFGCILIVVAGCDQKPVAVVNGDRITEKEFVDKLKETTGERILQQMIDRQIVEDAFQKAGLKLSEQDIAASIQEMQSRAPSPAAFEEYLIARGVTLEDLREDLQLQMKVNMLATKDVVVTEEQLEKFYEEHKERYDKPLRVKISEIVTPDKQQAEQALAALGKEGASFAAVAEQFSVSPATRQYGGQRPVTPIDELFPMELRDVVSGAQEGELIGPIETQQGWYVLQIEQRLPAETATFESAKEQVTEEFKGSRAVPLDGLLRQLRQEAVVKIVAPEYSELASNYAGPQELPEFGEEQSPPIITPETARPTPPPADQGE
ncbi:MAG: peptidyl-prolyl cis-trans isomerase [Armatimonadetes bacterium]|nr:peptidyl-prolyl cis-trans isomerase [Armatimonadota bacterium]